MTTSATRQPPRVIPRGRPRGLPKVMVPVKMTLEQRTRFKVACAEEGVSYADLVDKLLDEREAKRQRQQRQQAHPLHRPATSPFAGASE